MKPGLAADILAAVATLHHGDREQARDQLEAIWARVEPDDYVHRCVVAHYLADAQTDPAEELRYDLLALSAASAALPPTQLGEQTRDAIARITRRLG